MKQALRTGLNVTLGTTFGAFCALRMDDMIYLQLRRHMIQPITIILNTRSLNNQSLNELGLGTKEIYDQLRLKATKPTNTRELLVKDQDYSQPSDHLFAWVNEQQKMTDEQRELKEISVLKGLNLSTHISEEETERIISMKPDKF